MGGRVGWPVVIAAALVGAIVGALLMWATMTTGAMVKGAPLPTTTTGPSAQPTSPTPTPTPKQPTGPGRGSDQVLREASALQFDANYDFDVRIDYAAGTAEVVELLTLANRGEPVDVLQLLVLPHFDAPGFREFDLVSLDVDGTPARVRWTQRGANLVVPLRSPLGHAGNASLRIEFTLHAGPAVDGLKVAALSKANDVMQLLLWYPILSDGRGFVAGGDPIGSTPASDVTYAIRSATLLDFAVPGTITSKSPTEVIGRLEHARDFAFAVSPSFKTWSGRSGDTTVEVYARAGEDGATARDSAVAVLDRIGRLLAAPYPASRFVVVGGNSNAESSGMVLVHRDALGGTYTVAHETVHQWFPWLVGSDQLQEPWLDEALAAYLGKRLRPPDEHGYCGDRPVNTPAYAFPDVSVETSRDDCAGYARTVYWKGAWMLHAFNRAMGREAFVAALREYVATFSWEIATGPDLLAILRRHSPALTDELLGEWLALESPTSFRQNQPAS